MARHAYPNDPGSVRGDRLTQDQRAEACRRYVHRFTRTHKPAWANKPRPDGYAYSPQFASDTDWLNNTWFPVTKAGRLASGDCYSTPTWPDGQ